MAVTPPDGPPADEGQSESPSSANRTPLLIAALVALIALIGGIAIVTSGDDEDGATTATTATSSPGDDADGTSTSAETSTTTGTSTSEATSTTAAPSTTDGADNGGNPEDGQADNPAQAARKWIFAVINTNWDAAWSLTGPDTQGDLGDQSAYEGELGLSLQERWTPWGPGVSELFTYVAQVPSAGEDELFIIVMSGVPDGGDLPQAEVLVTRVTPSDVATVEFRPGRQEVQFQSPTDPSTCIDGPSETAALVPSSAQMFMWANGTQVTGSATPQGDETLLEHESNGEFVEDTAVTMASVVGGRVHVDTRQWVRNC